MRFAIRSRGAAVVVALTALAACSKDDSTGPGSAGDDGDYYGIFSASDGITAFGGALFIRIQAANATGTLTPSGGSGISLTGSFNTSTKLVNLAGSGHTLVGTVVSGVLSGDYAGPGGSGQFATQRGSSSEVQQYCGTFDGDATGTWNLSRRAGSLSGAYASDDGDYDTLSGTISGSSISISFTGGSASGTLSGNTMNGTWTAGGNAGTWTGSTPC
jgi:hypothetical protein